MAQMSKRAFRRQRRDHVVKLTRIHLWVETGANDLEPTIAETWISFPSPRLALSLGKASGCHPHRELWAARRKPANGKHLLFPSSNCSSLELANCCDGEGLFSHLSSWDVGKLMALPHKLSFQRATDWCVPSRQAYVQRKAAQMKLQVLVLCSVLHENLWSPTHGWPIAKRSWGQNLGGWLGRARNMMGNPEEAPSGGSVVKQKFTGLFNSQSPQRDDCPHHRVVLVITSCLSLWWVTLYSENVLPPLGQYLVLCFWLGLL